MNQQNVSKYSFFRVTAHTVMMWTSVDNLEGSTATTVPGNTAGGPAPRPQIHVTNVQLGLKVAFTNPIIYQGRQFYN